MRQRLCYQMRNRPQNHSTLNSFSKVGRELLLAALIGVAAIGTAPLSAQTASESEDTNAIRIVEAEGVVEIMSGNAQRWVLTQTNQPLLPFDRLRTGPRSRAVIRWSDQSLLPLNALTEIEILPPGPRDE